MGTVGAAPVPAGLLEGKLAQLPGGAGVWVVRQVPHLAGRVGMFAEDGEAFADVGDVGVSVWLVGVAETLAVFPAKAAGIPGRRGWIGRRRADRNSPTHGR